MDTFSTPIDTDAVRELVSHSGDPCVSIYLNLAETASAATDSQRLQNLIRMATRLLQGRGRSSAEAAELLHDISRLAENSGFSSDAPGMGLFASPGYSASFALGSAPMEQVSVNSLFHIRPLLERMDQVEVLGAAMRSRLAGIEQLRAAESEAVAEDLQQVLDAARNGEVELLFISSDCRLSGNGKGLNDDTRMSYAGADLANQAAIWTIERGGEVLMTAPDELGNGTKLLAGLRSPRPV
ncbi:MAG: hypothetical protein R3F46_15860 [bacterium]